MSVTHVPILPPNRTSPPLELPAKLIGVLSSPALLTQVNGSKRVPPLPTKPKPPPSEIRSCLTQRLSADRKLNIDSSPDTSPKPTLKGIPLTKKLSLDSATFPSISHTPLSPTRSSSNISANYPPAIKPKPPNTLTPNSSPVTLRRISSGAVSKPAKPRIDSPVIAPKPLFPYVHKHVSSPQIPYVTPSDTNSEDSGIFISPDKSLPELPPKLPARPSKSQPEKPSIVSNIILVPKIERREQHWTTNTSDLFLPTPLPTLPAKPSPVEDKKSTEGQATDSKLFRTLPSRGTKKRRANLKHHTDAFAKPTTPPPVLKAQESVPIQNEVLDNNILQLQPQASLNLSHSFDSLDSGDSLNHPTRRSDSTSNIPKKVSTTSNEIKSGKMKRAFLKALGVSKKDRTPEPDVTTSLSSSISTPTLNQTASITASQSVQARVSQALNMSNKGSLDDSFVFENVSDAENDTPPLVLSKRSYDASHRISSEFDAPISPLRPKKSKSPSKRSINAPASGPASGPASPQLKYGDFQYVFENEDSDTDSPFSDVEAFDDFDEILNDSDNEMTEEEVNKAKMRTIARAASGVTLSKCYYVAKEILSTEETYVRKLRLLHVDFPQALEEASKRNGKPIVSEDVLKKIFSNLSELYQINDNFKCELKKRVDNWITSPANQMIGDIMERHAHFIKAYTPFISNFDNALKLLDELTKKNNNFAQFLAAFHALPKCFSLPVSAHLLDVVQRIPRYKLLLEQYIKHLPEDSDDREGSEKALTLMTEVAIQVNENLRMIDNFNKMIDVLSKIEGDLSNMIVPSRQFIKGGELKKVCRKGLQVRAFFLFTDVLLHTSLPGAGSSNYSLHTRIPLAGMKVSELEQAGDLSENDPLKHGFKIISAIRSFIVVPASQEEKEEWLSILNKTLFELQSKMVTLANNNHRTSIFVEPNLLDNGDAALGSLAPVWIQDDSVSMCMICYNNFTFARRRHHCRVCGKVLCGPCSNYKASIKYLSNKQARCCCNCYEKLTGCEEHNLTPTAEEIDPVSSISEIPDSTRRNKRSRLRKEKSLVPAHLIQSSASDIDYQIRGNLEYSENSSNKFKHTRWVVLRDSVLYIFKKREDAAAIQTVPILGYSVEVNSDTVFSLNHKNVQNRFFRAENKEIAEKWTKELSRILSDTVADQTNGTCSPAYQEEGDKPAVFRTRRSATTSQVPSTQFEGEMTRSQQLQSENHSTKCLSTGGMACIDTTKASEPLSPTDSVIQVGVETDSIEKEDLTDTIREDQSNDCLEDPH